MSSTKFDIGDRVYHNNVGTDCVGTVTSSDNYSTKVQWDKGSRIAGIVGNDPASHTTVFLTLAQYRYDPSQAGDTDEDI